MSQSFWLFGTHLNILADEKTSGSHYDLIEGILPSGIETPLHLHSKYAEELYVLEGELTIYTDRQTVVLHAGEHFFIPVGTPHVVAATGATASKAITVASPSGFAELIRTAGTPGAFNEAPSNPNDMELFMQVSIAIGDTILAPPGARPEQITD